MYSFIRTDGVNQGGIYRLSRNPMYVGGFLFLVGMAVMGWGITWANLIFIGCIVFWAFVIHGTVKKEEQFLQDKYGDSYAQFKQKIPRYIGIPKQ